MTIVNPTMPTPGSPRGGEEIDLANAVQALLSDYNGNIDTTNLKDGAVTKVKLATDALNAFLKLLVPGDRKVAFGVHDNGGAAWGLVPDRVFNIPHGLLVIPSWWIAWGTKAVSTIDAQDPTVCTRISEDATNLVVKQSTLYRGNCNLPGAPVYWLAIS